MSSKTEEAKRFIKNQKRKKLKILFSQISIFTVFLLLWEFLSAKEIINSFLVSSPSSIFILLQQYIANGELFTHISISLYETILGLIIGTVFGVIVAVLLWWFNQRNCCSGGFYIFNINHFIFIQLF